MHWISFFSILCHCFPFYLSLFQIFQHLCINPIVYNLFLIEQHTNTHNAKLNETMFVCLRNCIKFSFIYYFTALTILHLILNESLLSLQCCLRFCVFFLYKTKNIFYTWKYSVAWEKNCIKQKKNQKKSVVWAEHIQDCGFLFVAFCFSLFKLVHCIKAVKVSVSPSPDL